MPIQLSGRLQAPGEIQWRQNVTHDAVKDAVLVLDIGADLFSRLPGLRNAGGRWELDVAKLSLPRTLQGAHWLPRQGVFPASVGPSDSGGYAVTISF